MTLRLVWYVDLVYTYLPFQYGENRRSLRQSNVDFKVWPWTPNIWPWCWPMTLRSLGYIDLVYTYLPFKYGDDLRSLRQSNGYFEVWPWTPNIWPWGQKFKIPSHAIFLYWPKEHFYVVLLLSYQNCRTSSKNGEKSAKNGNDLGDLDFDLGTLRSLGYVDLVHTYPPYKYEHDQRSLRQSNANFKVWPWTANIWPWGRKFKIPPHAIFLYWPKEHFCAFLSLSYQNCRTSSKKYEKSA